MTVKSQTQSRTLRLSACYLHPTEPFTGFCAACLRDRLSSLDTSDPLEPSTSSSSTAFAHSLENVGGISGSHQGAVTSRRTRRAASAYSPGFRRCRSVSVGKCEASAGISEPRRVSCDVRARNTLADFFDIDDENKGSDAVSKVESKNIGLSRLTGTLVESAEEDENGEEIRVFQNVPAPDLIVDDTRNEEGDLITIKEYIDIEYQSRKQNAMDFKDIAGSFLEVASVFSKKLRKWRQKQKAKKSSSNNGGSIASAGGDLLPMRAEKLKGKKSRETQSEIGDYVLGRRSCDTEPRFSIDAGRTSIEGSRISFDEPRASWDGYLVARTIPRLTPLVENMMFGQINRTETRPNSIHVDGQMHSINEDETSSGGSAPTISDSSSSKGQSSFDRSSSVRSSNVKLVITEEELKDWHLNSLREGNSNDFETVSKDKTGVIVDANSIDFMKANSSRWQKVYNTLSFRQSIKVKKHETFTDENHGLKADGLLKGDSTGKLIRSSSVNPSSISKIGGLDRRCGSVLEIREEARGKNVGDKTLERNYDDGMLRFYLTPMRSFRSKNGKQKLKNSASVAGDIFRLN